AAQMLEAIARAIDSRFGMRVVIHHHAGTFIETAEEIRRILAATDPARIGLLIDTGHAVYGGADPIALLEEHGSRVRYVHLKDARGSELSLVRTTNLHMDEAWKRGVFCPLGAGVVDFPKFIARLLAVSYSGWAIVEQDVVRDPQGNLRPDPFRSAVESRN